MESYLEELLEKQYLEELQDSLCDEEDRLDEVADV